MRAIICALAFHLLLPAQDAPVTSWPAELAAAVAQEAPSLEELYRDLHEHPEISYQEEATAARLAGELEKAGFEVTRGVGGHGVVGVLRNGEGAVVLIRTDMDALPLEERTDLPFASQVTATDDQGREVPVMHACGHDVHMSTWTGVARMLARFKDRWHGTVLMIGQPAEERGGGARAMLEDGLYKRWPVPDYALALHVDAALESGHVGWTSGFVLANVDSVDILVHGVGGHGAYPHGAKDPIVLASEIVVALQTLVSREVDPLQPAVVTVGSIHGGTKHNIIPDQVKLQLTVRSYGDDVRRTLLQGIRRIARNQGRSAGLAEDLLPEVMLHEDEATPATWNDPELVTRTVAVFREHLGQEHVDERDPQMGGEDFSHYSRAAEKTKGFMFRLGTVPAERMAAAAQPGGPGLPTLHSPFYAPEYGPAIKTGVRAMTAAAVALLQPPPDSPATQDVEPLPHGSKGWEVWLWREKGATGMNFTLIPGTNRLKFAQEIFGRDDTMDPVRGTDLEALCGALERLPRGEYVFVNTHPLPLSPERAVERAPLDEESRARLRSLADRQDLKLHLPR